MTTGTQFAGETTADTPDIADIVTNDELETGNLSDVTNAEPETEETTPVEETTTPESEVVTLTNAELSSIKDKGWKAAEEANRKVDELNNLVRKMIDTQKPQEVDPVTAMVEPLRARLQQRVNEGQISEETAIAQLDQATWQAEQKIADDKRNQQKESQNQMFTVAKSNSDTINKAISENPQLAVGMKAFFDNMGVDLNDPQIMAGANPKQVEYLIKVARTQASVELQEATGTTRSGGNRSSLSASGGTTPIVTPMKFKNLNEVHEYELEQLRINGQL